MVAGLRALLAGIIDYAGLFPPAKLPLDQAIRNYARYRDDPDSWMLGRFIGPAGRLAELARSHEDLLRSGGPWQFSVLAGATTGGNEFRSQLRSDLGAVGHFETNQNGRAVVGALEVRLPWEDPGAIQPVSGLPLVAQVYDIFRQLWVPSRMPYFETPRGSMWRQSASEWVEVIAEVNAYAARQPGVSSRPAGYKLRCGGLEPSAFPSAEQVAFIITACRDRGVPLKFTAGLHHPLLHFDPNLDTTVHGFLNVFCAGVLAHSRRLAESQVQTIIEEENAANFKFDDEGFRWKDWQATTDEIVAARKNLVTSFGSCSFDEPREDLRKLGLLD
jgi:hypothetical protein